MVGIVYPKLNTVCVCNATRDLKRNVVLNVNDGKKGNPVKVTLSFVKVTTKTDKNVNSARNLNHNFFYVFRKKKRVINGTTEVMATTVHCTLVYMYCTLY